MKNFSKPVSNDCTRKILDQMDNYFYKINEKDDKFDICIFCHIKYKNEKISIAIINNFMIDDNMIYLTINKNEII